MKASLRKLLCERAGNNDGHARPDWDDESVPMCSESCVHNGYYGGFDVQCREVPL